MGSDLKAEKIMEPYGNVTFDWNCRCIACGFNYIWVVRVGYMLRDITTNEAVFDRNNGTPIFLLRGRSDQEYDWWGPDWTSDISKAKHFIDHESAETAMAEALILHPSLIGRADSVQFRIR